MERPENGRNPLASFCSCICVDGLHLSGIFRWIEGIHPAIQFYLSDFSMDPKEQLAAVKDMRKNGYVPLGNFHSHPESPSRPSEEDKRLAYDSKANYLILSLMEADNPVLNAFLVDEEKQVTKEELVIS